MNDHGPVVIVGTGPAAAATVESYREHGGSAPVIMLGAEPRPPYERPPLSKDYLRGETPIDDLFLHDPGWYEDKGVELKLGVGARSLDPGGARVIDETGNGWEFGRCVIATGSRPALPDIPGLDLPGVRFMRTIEDADWLTANTGPGTKALVVGSGFIGCEVAASLAARGAEVRIAALEERPQLERLGAEASDRISAWLREGGVGLLGGVSLESIEQASSGSGLVARFSGGSEDEAEADLAIVCLGVARNVEWAEGAGLSFEQGAIRVDAAMRTQREGVLAAGDVAFAENASAGRHLLVEHWGEALNQGEVAGATLAGADDEWDSAPGFWSTIGGRTLKQVAWGDGYDEAHLETHGPTAFTVRYERDGELVGVLTHERDEDYEDGRRALEKVK